jgi:copper(I)-binding protein
VCAKSSWPKGGRRFWSGGLTNLTACNELCQRTGLDRAPAARVSDQGETEGRISRMPRHPVIGCVVGSIAVLAAALASGSASAMAQNDARANLRIEHPYARPTPPGARTGGAYLTIENRGQQDRLIRVATPAAGAAEIHSMTMEGNVMRMRAVAAVEIPSHATTALKPGGFHVMLMDLKQPLVAGGTLPLSLTFEKAGTIDVTARVEAPESDRSARN